MIRKLTVAVLAVCLLMATTLVYAQDVFITKNGKKYHQEICRLIQNKQISKIDEQAAVEKGLTPCKKCMKENLSTAEKVKKDNKS
ncbi:MAG: hypothetical protein A2Z88_01020 [Omnitrophica WOR_2 bacterium GWA2_47_8]|nr:MAG: hypothetical protein A2Z88_01020 [Omnitrophica WOR_2 bacterium GWA2_47_8]